MKNTLQAFQPIPHPLKQLFQEHQVSQVVVSKYMHVSMSLINHWLNGYCPVPDHHKARLQQLVRHIKGAC